MNDLQRKLKEKDIKIKKLETALESAGVKISEGGSPSASPDTGFQKKVADLEAKIQALQFELGEAKKRNAPQAIGDLAKDLQAKIRKRDETIARLEAEVKQIRGEHIKEKDPKIKTETSMAGSQATTPDLLTLQIRVAELEERNRALEEEHKARKKPKDTPIINDLPTELQLKLRKKEEYIARMEGELKQLREELGKIRAGSTSEVVKGLEEEVKKKDEFIAKLEKEIQDMGKPKLPTDVRWWF